MCILRNQETMSKATRGNESIELAARSTPPHLPDPPLLQTFLRMPMTILQTRVNDEFITYSAGIVIHSE